MLGVHGDSYVRWYIQLQNICNVILALTLYDTSYYYRKWIAAAHSGQYLC